VQQYEDWLIGHWEVCLCPDTWLLWRGADRQWKVYDTFTSKCTSM